MSFQEGGNLSPYVSSVSPATASEAGNTTFTIDGGLFSPSMAVDVPSGLGTLVSVAITQPTSTSSRAVIVVNVTAPTSTPVNREITLSNGGESGASSVATIQHVSFTPSSLIKGSYDYWWNPDSLSSSYSDAAQVSSFPSSGGSLTLTEATGESQVRYIHNETWSTGKVASGLGFPSHWSNDATTYRFFGDTVVPLASSSGNIENLTIAFAIKNTASNAWGNGKYSVNLYLGSSVYIQYRTTTSHYYGWRASGIGYTNPGDFDDLSDRIRTVFYTITNSTNARLVIPQSSIDVTGTTSATAIPTAPSKLYSSQTLPILHGETLVLNYAITDAERANLQAYWADKYGA